MRFVAVCRFLGVPYILARGVQVYGAYGFAKQLRAGFPATQRLSAP